MYLAGFHPRVAVGLLLLYVYVLIVAFIYACEYGGAVNPTVLRLILLIPGSPAGNAEPSGLRCAKQNSICVSAPSGCVFHPLEPSIFLKSSFKTSICD